MRPLLLATLLLCACSSNPSNGSGGAGGSSSGGGTATGGGSAAGGGGGGGGSATGGGTAACVPNVVFAPAITVTTNGHGTDAGYFLVSDRLEVRTTNFSGCAKVRLDFSLADDAGFFSSWGDFATDGSGVADTLTDAPSAGTWEGVDVDGPLWSMNGPQVHVFDYDLFITASDDAGHVVHQTVPRKLYPNSTTVTSVTTNGIVATLYRPAGAGPFAAVLTFGGSEGGIAGGDLMARGLVGEGVVTMSLAYFGATGVPGNLDLIPLEYFETALDVLRAQPFVRSDRVAVMGASRGGEAALLVGSTFASKTAATFAVVPSGYVWPAWGVWTESSWTYQSNPLTFVPWANGNELTVADGGMQLVYQNVLFEQSLQQATAQQLAAAEIAVEAAQGPVLMFASSDDGIWPSCTLALAAWGRLEDAGHPANHPLDSYHCFSGSGHAINPARVGVPVGITLYSPLGGNQYLSAGGDAKDTAHASRQARDLVDAVLTQLKQ